MTRRLSFKELRILGGGFLALALAGCATGKHEYWVNAAGRYDFRTESYASGLGAVITEQTGVSTTTVAGDDSKLQTRGIGFQVGITERSEKLPLETELNFFYTKYTSLDYTFLVTGPGVVSQRIAARSYGLDAKIGWNFWGFLRPHLSYRLGRLDLDSTVTAGSPNAVALSAHSSMFVVGGGLAVFVPFSDSFRLAVEGDYQIPLSLPSGISAREMTVQAGLQIHLFDLGK